MLLRLRPIRRRWMFRCIYKPSRCTVEDRNLLQGLTSARARDVLGMSTLLIE